MNSKTYFWFNCIWAGIITAMLFYAGFFAYSSHAVQCVYKDATGIDCATCGITRGFHHVLVGNFKTAYQLNPLSLQLFLFFAIQLIMRLCFMFLPSLRNNRVKVIRWDIIITLLLFAVCFFPLITQLFKS